MEGWKKADRLLKGGEGEVGFKGGMMLANSRLVVKDSNMPLLMNIVALSRWQPIASIHFFKRFDKRQ